MTKNTADGSYEENGIPYFQTTVLYNTIQYDVELSYHNLLTIWPLTLACIALADIDD